MALIAKENTSNSFKPVPSGSYLARCYRIVDLGTQRTTFQGTESFKHLILMSFEIHGDDPDGNPLVTDRGEPMSISKRYTFSLSPKSNLRKDLESWRKTAFTGDELKGFDLTNVVGHWAMISVIQEKNNGETYTNISAIMAVPDVMRKSLPKAFNPKAIFSLEDPDMEVFETLSDKLKSTIKQSPEWIAFDEGSGMEQDMKSAEEEEEIPF